MEIFVSIIILVFGILQIILFFKVWGMTNDVRTIKQSLNSDSRINEAKLYYLKGDKSKAKELLDDAFFMTIIEACSNSTYAYFEVYPKIENKFREIYENMEFALPDFEKYKDQDNIP